MALKQVEDAYNASRPRRKVLSVQKPKPVSKVWEHNQFLDSLLGKSVMACLPDESTIKGELISFDRYTILLRTETGADALIFKSALDFIMEQKL